MIIIEMRAMQNIEICDEHDDDDEGTELRMSFVIKRCNSEQRRESMIKCLDDEPFWVASLLPELLPFNISTNISVLMDALVLLTDGLESGEWEKDKYANVLRALWAVENAELSVTNKH